MKESQCYGMKEKKVNAVIVVNIDIYIYKFFLKKKKKRRKD